MSKNTLSECGHDARAIANVIVGKLRDKENPSVMKVLKLVYLVQGWSLALRDKSMVNSPVQAWQYGPVFPDVYSAFRRFGSAPITTYATDPQSGAIYAASIDSEENELIDAVLGSYGDMHAFQLSGITHQPDTPWTITFEASGSRSEISQDLIRSHFVKISQAGS